MNFEDILQCICSCSAGVLKKGNLVIEDATDGGTTDGGTLFALGHITTRSSWSLTQPLNISCYFLNLIHRC